MVSRGFTLVEVLVALVIVAYVGISAQQRLGQFLDERAAMQSRHEAHWVAWNELMRSYQQSVWGNINGEEKLSSRGDTRFLGHTWFYQRDQQSTLNGELIREQVQVQSRPFAATGREPLPNDAALVMYRVK